MKNDDRVKESVSNFWLSFVLGFFLGGGAIFLLGTKKGRKFLKKIIQSAEELETSLEAIVEDVGVKIEEKKEIINPPLSSVLEKIKSSI
jgi:hypothetical protein